jgi:hypothetical protein
MYQLFMDFKKVYESLKKVALNNHFFEFCISMTLIRVIKLCLTEAHSRTRVDNNLSEMFQFRNVVKGISIAIAI